jgi:hypothetical protein
VVAVVVTLVMASTSQAHKRSLSAVATISRVEVTVLSSNFRALLNRVRRVTLAAKLVLQAGGGSQSTNVLGSTLELVEALFTASQRTTLALELFQRDGGEFRSGVVLGTIVVNLVNGNCGVDNSGLDNLLVEYGLNGLMDVLKGC